MSRIKNKKLQEAIKDVTISKYTNQINLIHSQFPEYSLTTIRAYIEVARRGFNNFNEYQEYLALIKGKKSRHENERDKKPLQDCFEESMISTSNHRLDTFPSQIKLEEKLEKNELINIMFLIINEKLEERQRKVLLNHYLENKSFTDIGIMLNISRQRAYDIHRRAIFNLRKYILK